MTSARILPRLDSVRRIVERAGIAPREAEDVAQDALLRIWEKLDRIDPSGDVAAWMSRVAVNLARDHLRTPRVRVEVLTPFDEGDEIADDRLDPEAHALLRARLAVLQLLIDQIDARRRDVFVEHELLGKSLAEIAAHHRIPESTAATRLRKAWEEVDAARVRWQAAQRRRGRDILPALLAPLVDLKAWVTRGRAPGRSVVRFRALVGAVAVLMITALPIPWTPFRAAPRPAPLAPVVAAAPIRHPPGVSAANLRPGAPPAAGVAPRPPSGRAPRNSDEDALIGLAHAALATGDLLEAERRLDEHAEKFPLGSRAAERNALLNWLR